MRRTLVPSVIALIVLSTVGHTYAQDAFRLDGHVLGEDNKAKSGVHIYFDGPRSYFALSDNHGRFTIEQFQAGQYSVRVQQGDYALTRVRNITANNIKLVVDW